ncbi:Periplasmic serine endoprotease DegP [Alphaproteobacteria bacterium SO-S41]|nr:Periplasmic serine endoprotease DegP [Alphaproteobacteria bacterium SO-S41]
MRNWFLLALALAVTPAAAQDAAPPKTQVELTATFAPVVKRIAPAVVNVYAKTIVHNPYAGDPFYEEFYGPQQDRTQNSLGSGVIVRPDGLIVTNNHVIDGADELIVVLSDRREFEAKVQVADARTDIALLKIETNGEQLPTLPFRDSDSAEVGDLVLAVGNPFGVGQTVTMGIISAVARTNAGISDYQSFIQTDAAINPGNSGGALVTADGQLIGINTAIFSRSGGSIGIGFAIPSNMVRATIDGAGTGGKIARAWLGAETQELTHDIAASLGLDRPQGVIVRSIFSGGPADKAGLKTGDVVMKIDGFEVNDPQAVRYRIATAGLGKVAKLEGPRDGTWTTWNVTLESPPDGDRKTITIDGRNPMAGAKVANLSPAYADELGIADMSGVVVLDIDRRSLARRYGFRPGDIIAKVNDAETADVAALDGALKAGERKGWRIAVKRGGEVLTLEVSP